MKHLKTKTKIVIAIVFIVLLGLAYRCGVRIVYAPELDNNWNAISGVAAWVGAIGTIAVLWYNHKTIELTQRSVKQAIDLQLYEKRLELYNKIADDQAFSDTVPITLKIVYSEEIYQLYCEIAKLCDERWDKIWEFALVFHIIGWETRGHGNVCEELYKRFTEQIDQEIRLRKEGNPTKYVNEKQIVSLECHKNDTDLLHKQICEKYAELEEKMRTILNQSMKV